MKDRALKRGLSVGQSIIIIAVVIVLAAAMIVTAFSAIKKGNVSSDSILVENFNNILKESAQLGAKNTTPHDAAADLLAKGYNISLIKASTKDYKIVWNSVTDEFVLLNEKDHPIYPTVSGEKNSLYKIPEDTRLLYAFYTEIPDLEDQSFGIYLLDGATVNAGTVYDINTNFDAGNNQNVNIKLATNEHYAYSIRTSGGGSIKIDAQNATVNHYGKVAKVNVDSIYAHSYHEFGDAETVTLTKGHLVAESGSTIAKLLIAGSVVTVDAPTGSRVSSLEVDESAKTNPDVITFVHNNKARICSGQ